jgi:hypothetical protein
VHNPLVSLRFTGRVLPAIHNNFKSFGSIADKPAKKCKKMSFFFTFFWLEPVAHLLMTRRMHLQTRPTAIRSVIADRAFLEQLVL